MNEITQKIWYPLLIPLTRILSNCWLHKINTLFNIRNEKGPNGIFYQLAPDTRSPSCFVWPQFIITLRIFLIFLWNSFAPVEIQFDQVGNICECNWWQYQTFFFVLFFGDKLSFIWTTEIVRKCLIFIT